MIFVRTADVDWIEAMDNYVRLHVGRETHSMRETLTHLEQRLPRAIVSAHPLIHDRERRSHPRGTTVVCGRLCPHSGRRHEVDDWKAVPGSGARTARPGPVARIVRPPIVVIHPTAAAGCGDRA